MKRLRALGVCVLTVLLLLSACAVALPAQTPGEAEVPPQVYGGESKETREDGADAQGSQDEPDERLPAHGEYYYDLTNVVLYLEIYGELPPNYITKKDAQALGWEGGSVEKYSEGAAIGGDHFGNYEGLLPNDNGERYTECDIDTNGYPSRGPRRLVFSGDGRYFYTSDHYESFTEYQVTADYEVVPCE